MATEEKNYLEMSDEEIRNESAPASAPAVDTPDPDTTDPDLVPEGEPDPPAVVDEDPDPETDPNADPDLENQPDPAGEKPGDEDTGKPASDDGTKSPAAPAAKGDGGDKEDKGADGSEQPDSKQKGEGGEKPDPTPKAKFEPTPENQKTLYDLILGKPIRANGKDIQLESPDEAVKLIQMGMNYTKKMQQLHPSLRVVKMLDNNGLLDEQKIAHLIDLEKGDTKAIQKFLTDKKFDPTTVDEEQAASYKPGDHQVSDLDMRFDAALDDIESTPTGAELIQELGKWDKESKQAVYQEPTILSKINEHKASGLYAHITKEMDRQKLLGHLDNSVPFLQAYYAVGDMLSKTGALKQEEPVQKTPLETRTAQKPKLPNGDKAQAAAATKAAAAKATQQTNFLDLPDDEFEKLARSGKF